MRVPKTLTFKMRPSVQPFLWKWVFCMRMKNHFHIKGWALNLVMIQRPGELGNGQFLLITLVSILIIPDITETESYNCFIILFYYYYPLFWRKKRQTHSRTEHSLACSWKSPIARATYSWVSFLLADDSLSGCADFQN